MTTAKPTDAQSSRKFNKLELREPSKRPLSQAEERMKENAKLLNLTEAEAEIFARGRS